MKPEVSVTSGEEYPLKKSTDDVGTLLFPNLILRLRLTEGTCRWPWNYRYGRPQCDGLARFIEHAVPAIEGIPTHSIFRAPPGYGEFAFFLPACREHCANVQADLSVPLYCSFQFLMMTPHIGIEIDATRPIMNRLRFSER